MYNACGREPSGTDPQMFGSQAPRWGTSRRFEVDYHDRAIPVYCNYGVFCTFTYGNLNSDKNIETHSQRRNSNNGIASVGATLQCCIRACYQQRTSKTSQTSTNFNNISKATLKLPYWSDVYTLDCVQTDDNSRKCINIQLITLQ